MVRNNKKFIFIYSIILLLIITLAYSHSGRTDQYGCHTCRTNCEEKWGIPYGFYHRHNPVRPCFEEETKPVQSPTLPTTEPEQISEPSSEITGKIIEEKTTEEKPAVCVSTPAKEIKSFDEDIIQKNQPKENKTQKEAILTSAKKEEGFFKLIINWFLRFFK